MRRDAISFMFLTIIILSGCSRVDPGLVRVPILEYANSAKEYDLEAITETTGYLVLESNDSCLITYPRMVTRQDGVWYLFADRLVYSFSEDGRYLSTFGKLGRGPNEFLMAVNFAVHPEQDLVLVLAHSPLSLFFYTKSGEFIKKLPVDIRTSSVAINGNNIILGFNTGAGKEPYSYGIYNMDCQLLAARPNHYLFEFETPPDVLFIESPVFTNRGGELYVKVIHSDTVFRISDTISEPVWLFDTGKMRYTVAMRAAGLPSTKESLKVIWHHLYKGNIFIRYFNIDMGWFLALHNIKSGTYSSISLNKSIKNDFQKAVYTGLGMGMTEDGEFYSVVQAVTLLKYMEEDPELKREIMQLHPGFNENSNPVIVTFRIKESALEWSEGPSNLVP
jgi:hypothetical protein